MLLASLAGWTFRINLQAARLQVDTAVASSGRARMPTKLGPMAGEPTELMPGTSNPTRNIILGYCATGINSPWSCLCPFTYYRVAGMVLLVELGLD